MSSLEASTKSVCTATIEMVHPDLLQLCSCAPEIYELGSLYPHLEIIFKILRRIEEMDVY